MGWCYRVQGGSSLLSWKCPSRHTQKCVSHGTLDPVKLMVKVSHHTALIYNTIFFLFYTNVTIVAMIIPERNNVQGRKSVHLGSWFSPLSAGSMFLGS